MDINMNMNFGTFYSRRKIGCAIDINFTELEFVCHRNAGHSIQVWKFNWPKGWIINFVKVCHHNFNALVARAYTLCSVVMLNLMNDTRWIQPNKLATCAVHELWTEFRDFLIESIGRHQNGFGFICWWIMCDTRNQWSANEMEQWIRWYENYIYTVQTFSCRLHQKVHNNTFLQCRLILHALM